MSEESRSKPLIQVLIAVIGASATIVAALIAVSNLGKSNSPPVAAATLAAQAPSSTPTGQPTTSGTPIKSTSGASNKPNGAPGQAAGQLVYNRSAFSRGVDLSAEGSTDWIMWGYKPSDDGISDRFTGGWVADECPDTQCSNRKQASSSYISNYTVEGGARPYRLRDRQGPAFSWSNGSPIATVASAQSLVYVGGAGNGFSLSVQADQNVRTLRLYLAVYQGAVGISVHLSDHSAADVSDPSFNALDQHTVAKFGVLDVRYRAQSAGQTLKIDLTLNSDAGGGNISIFAATLH